MNEMEEGKSTMTGFLPYSVFTKKLVLWKKIRGHSNIGSFFL